MADLAEKIDRTVNETQNVPNARLTPFQKKVFSALKQIPSGKVTTYQDLACMIGSRSARAVGQALKSNPYAPAVPCHRVVRSDGSLGGYMGATGGKNLQKKRTLLQSEGIRIDPKTGRIPESQIIRSISASPSPL